MELILKGVILEAHSHTPLSLPALSKCVQGILKNIAHGSLH
jgi:hypothetical protein